VIGFYAAKYIRRLNGCQFSPEKSQKPFGYFIFFEISIQRFYLKKILETLS